MLEHGRELRTDFDGASGDALYVLDKVYQLYPEADSHCSGRVTVPTLWDKQRATIVTTNPRSVVEVRRTSRLSAAPCF
jgi:putative glutathione S-transferase